MLILKGENGYICHHKSSNTLDASRSVYDIFTLSFNDGAYHIKGTHTDTGMGTQAYTLTKHSYTYTQSAPL